MSDIIERAEALNPDNHYAWRGEKATMFPELVAALKDERAENERLQGIIDAHHDGLFLMTEHNSEAKDCVHHPPKTPGVGICATCSTYDNATWLTQRETIYGDDD